MTFAEWNDAIVRRFFNELNAGKRVFLAVDGDVLTGIGGAGGTAEFVAAVKKEGGARVCRTATAVRERWRAKGGTGLPPYVAYLGVLVLAASTEGEYPGEGFQKRLHRLLGEEITNTPPPGFYNLWELWDDLEIWANEDNKGGLGTFACPLLGASLFVDQFCSQIVLTERERKRLPELFSAAELDPSSPPAAEELSALAVRYGQGRLQPKTLRRLSKDGAVDEDFRASTIEALLDELRNWDGVAEAGGGRLEFHTCRLSLRLIDRLSGRAVSRVIVSASEGVPEAAEFHETPAGGRSFRTARLDGSDWLELRTAAGLLLDASELRWEAGLRLSNGEATLRWSGRKVRVFHSGEFEELPGLVEVSRLDPYREVFVAVANSCSRAVDEWGKRAGEGWSEIALGSGLPRGWRLFHAQRTDPAVRAPADFGVLRTDPQTRILFRGGIKTRPASRRYFEFAPPAAHIEALSPGLEVYVNDVKRETGVGDVILKFDRGSVASSVKICVSRGAEPVCSASFQTITSEQVTWKPVGAIATSPLGAAAEVNECARAEGAATPNFQPPPLRLAFDRPADLIGAIAGQVANFPSEPLPTEWSPVWIVEHGRTRRRAIFCGGDPAMCAPVDGRTADRRRVREWKRVLWHERKNLLGPTCGAAAELWARYRDVAKHV